MNKFKIYTTLLSAAIASGAWAAEPEPNAILVSFNGSDSIYSFFSCKPNITHSVGEDGTVTINLFEGETKVGSWSSDKVKDILHVSMAEYDAMFYNGKEMTMGKLNVTTKLTGNAIAVVKDVIETPDEGLAKMDNVLWNTESGYEAGVIRLVDSLPAYFPVAFYADEISYTRTPSIYNQASQGATGWETLYLPFTATDVTADKNPIQPFNYGGDRENTIKEEGDFWAKEPVTSEGDTLYFAHILSTDFEAGKPYIIAFPGEGFDKYSLAGQAITFSASGADVPATDGLPSALKYGTYYMGGTSVGLTAGADNCFFQYTPSSNQFEKGKNGDKVTPFRCYVQSESQNSPNQLRSGRSNIVNVGSYEDYVALRKGTITLSDDNKADANSVYADGGNIYLNAGEAGVTEVFNVNGQLVKVANHNEGLNNLGAFAQGVYVVNGVKVIVK